MLGEELHYGVFEHDDEDLAQATRRLTELMIEALDVQPGLAVLDVGCGTGAPAARLAELGAAVTGVTTSAAGVKAASERVAAAGLAHLARFELRDGMDNGLPDRSFDRVWALESSHLMRDRTRLIAECMRVLKPGGRLALCDIMFQVELPFREVRRLRHEFDLLRQVFGDARMDPLATYVNRLEEAGLEVDVRRDLSSATRPTFARWRENAERYRDQVVPLLGQEGWAQFVEASAVLDDLWGAGIMGYGLVAGRSR